MITNVWDKRPVKDFVFCMPSLDRYKPKACVLTAPSEKKVCCIACYCFLLCILEAVLKPLSFFCFV